MTRAVIAGASEAGPASRATSPSGPTDGTGVVVQGEAHTPAGAKQDDRARHAGGLPEQAFFAGVPDEQKVVLNGKVLFDTAIIPNFCQTQLGINPDSLFEALLDCPTHPDDQGVQISDGWSPSWITGQNRALWYRGNPINRTKMWFQQGSSFEQGMRKYQYTGRQWGVSGATYRVEAIPLLAFYTTQASKAMGLTHPHNHWITTLYTNENDGITLHSDKMDNWEPESCFAVLKLGAPRPFVFTDLNGDELFNETLAAGTAVIVGTRANSLTKHAVPVVDEPCEPSGSIVGRAIHTPVPWEKVGHEIRNAERNREKRRAEKDERKRRRGPA